MESESAAREPGAKVDVRGMLRRRWLFGVVAVAAGIALGVAAGSAVGVSYRSSTSVLVTPTSAASGSARTEQPLNLETESQVVLSQIVAAAAAKQAGDPRSLPDLLAAVTVEVPPNTTVLSITAKDADPAAAQRLSGAFAAAYLEHRTATAQADADAAVKVLKGQLSEQQKQLSELTGPIASLPATSPDRTYAEAQQRILSDQITATSNAINSLTGTEISGGSILSDASAPVAPSLPVRSLVIAGGTLLGLVAGWMLMLWRESRDRVVRRPEDVEGLAIERCD